MTNKSDGCFALRIMNELKASGWLLTKTVRYKLGVQAKLWKNGFKAQFLSHTEYPSCSPGEDILA